MGGRLGAGVLSAAIALVLAPGAPAQLPDPPDPLPDPLPDIEPRDPGGFRNILPGGQGETVRETEFLTYQPFAPCEPGDPDPCEVFTDQIPPYNDLIYEAPDLERSDLRDHFKSERFGLEADEIDPTTSDVPRPGVTILRDQEYQVPHVFGDTRADVMFGAGYASANDRLFLMDVLRHTGRAELTELIGPGENNETVKMDAKQLKVADYSERELRQMIQTAEEQAGPAGERIRGDLRNYVAGVNEYIRRARTDTAEELPVEYVALGEMPEDWKATDTVAIASLIGGIFGKGGGSEARVSQALAAARKRFSGGGAAREVFEDFRREEDPEAPVTTTKRFEFDDPERRDSDAVAVADLGSVEPRKVIRRRSSSAPTSSSAPSWLQSLQQHGLVEDEELGFPPNQSNALLIPGSESASGNPLAVMGPQVGYFSPEILMELDLHGGGIDARGAAFPGISLYILLGRGEKYAWSATTATTDNVDEFAEVLCEPDGSRPTMKSDHYRYKGRCRPFERRRHVLNTGVIPSDPEGSNRTYVLRAERSVHGPIQSYGKVNGRPVAFAEARSTYFHELESAAAFERLNTNRVTGARSFQRTMNRINFAFNWFYADKSDVTFFQSGWFPRRAEGTDPSLPAFGTGRWDWKGFDPGTFLSRRMSFGEKPKDTNPERGYLVNWNNKQAPGWRAADDVFGSFSSVHRSERLEDRVRRDLRGRREISLTELTQAMELAATVDLRGQEVYPVLRRVMRPYVDGGRVGRLVAMLNRWVEDGAHRRDLSRNNVLEHSPAIAVMDAWWARLVKRIFRPTIGKPMLRRVRDLTVFGPPPSAGGSSFFSGWWGYVDKDLRNILGDRVRQPLSREYCGARQGDAATRRSCARVLIKSLKLAEEKAEKRYGVERVQDIQRPATCEPDPSYPRTCDQIEFEAAGAVETAPIHWQDRPTFQQIVEVGADFAEAAEAAEASAPAEEDLPQP